MSAVTIRPELRAALMQLPADERLKLADELYESVSVPPPDSTWREAWSAELEQRAQAVEDGRVDLVHGDTAHAQLRDELARLGQ